MCDCKVCTETLCWENSIDDPQQRNSIFEGMCSRITHSETEATYYKEILAGRWPGSMAILERVLKNAKSFLALDQKDVDKRA